LRIDDEAVLIFLGELSGSADDLIDLRLGPISAHHSGWSRPREIARRKEEPRQGGAESSGRTVERDIHNRQVIE
jgi:hypothetical protein